MPWIRLVVLFTGFLGGLAECPLYWTPHGDSCYVIPEIPLTWTSATGFCVAHGAYLAEITSQEENYFVSQFVKQNHPSKHELWIGGTDALSEGHWIWSHSGTLFQYQNWNVGEPNSATHAEQCLAFRTDGRWNDEFCSYKIHGICERSALIDPGVGK